MQQQQSALDKSNDLFRQENKLAESIISGIIDEIRSRSENSREKESSSTSSESGDRMQLENVGVVARIDKKSGIFSFEDRKIVLRRPVTNKTLPGLQKKLVASAGIEPEKKSRSSRDSQSVVKATEYSKSKNVDGIFTKQQPPIKDPKASLNEMTVKQPLEAFSDSKFLPKVSSKQRNELDVPKSVNQQSLIAPNDPRTVRKSLKASKNSSNRSKATREKNAIKTNSTAKKSSIRSPNHSKITRKTLDRDQHANAEASSNVKESEIQEPKKLAIQNQPVFLEALTKNERITRPSNYQTIHEEEPIKEVTNEEASLNHLQNVHLFLEEQKQTFSPSDLISPTVKSTGATTLLIPENKDNIGNSQNINEDSPSLDLELSDKETIAEDRELNVTLPGVYTYDTDNEEDDMSIIRETSANLSHSNLVGEATKTAILPKREKLDPILFNQTIHVIKDLKSPSNEKEIRHPSPVSDLSTSIKSQHKLMQSPIESDVNSMFVAVESENFSAVCDFEVTTEVLGDKGRRNKCSPLLFSISKSVPESPDRKEINFPALMR